MSERSVLRLLQKNYPTIYDELTQRPALSELDRVDHILTIYCKSKGMERGDVIKNLNQSRMIFIAIIAKAYDPMFFVDDDKMIYYGLSQRLSELLCCHRTQISHTLATVKTYLKVYRNFREEVAYLYGLIINQIANEN